MQKGWLGGQIEKQQISRLAIKCVVVERRLECPVNCNVMILHIVLTEKQIKNMVYLMLCLF